MGAVDYIRKPFDPEAVQKKVRNHLVQVTQVKAAPMSTGRRKSSRRTGDQRFGLSSYLAIGLLIAVVVAGFAAVQMDLVQPGPALDTANSPAEARSSTASKKDTAPTKSAPSETSGSANVPSLT